MFVIAARTAAIWMRTSLQSRPSGDHLPHGLQMADGTGQPVQDGPRVFVHMAVAVRGVVAVGMIVRFVVGIRFVVQVGNVVLMQVRMVVRMLVFHGGTLLIS